MRFVSTTALATLALLFALSVSIPAQEKELREKAAPATPKLTYCEPVNNLQIGACINRAAGGTLQWTLLLKNNGELPIAVDDPRIASRWSFRLEMIDGEGDAIEPMMPMIDLDAEPITIGAGKSVTFEMGFNEFNFANMKPADQNFELPAGKRRLVITLNQEKSDAPGGIQWHGNIVHDKLKVDSK